MFFKSEEISTQDTEIFRSQNDFHMTQNLYLGAQIYLI